MYPDNGLNQVFNFTPEQWRRIFWRNLSPVVERITQDGMTIARHVDGRFTLEKDLSTRHKNV